MSKYHNLALFAQDDIKVSSRLTLNIGLRWDYQPLPTEQYDRLHNFNPNLIDPATGLPGATEYAGTGPGRSGKRTFGNNSLTDFGPRFGFAYQISQKTAVRGGYGIFYNARNPQGWSGVPWGETYGFTTINTMNRAPGNVAAFNWDRGYPGQTVAVPPDLFLSDTT